MPHNPARRPHQTLLLPSLQLLTTQPLLFVAMALQGEGMCSFVDVPSVLERLASFPTALPVSLQLSLLHYLFAMPSKCSPLEIYCCWSLQDFCGLPRSSPVFSGVLQSLPELLLVCRSSCYFLRAPFPQSSLEILCGASPVF